MKKLINLCMFFLLFQYVNAQIDRVGGIDLRTQLSVVPMIQYADLSGSTAIIGGLAGVITFEDRFYFGSFYMQKMNRSFTEFPEAPDLKQDVSYRYVGGWLGSYFNTGLKRRQGRYIRRLTQLDLGIKVGGGKIWLNNEDKDQCSTEDYFYRFEPTFGLSRSIAKHIDFNIGAYYALVVSVDKLKTYFDNSSLSGIGAYVGLRINLFK